ncbi:MAG: riboflavin synthase [Actinomycetales bacterium]|nr:riboflavin synthase [Actinomycetales bacterium]
MFTGLIEDCGVITSIKRLTESAEIEIKTALSAQIKVGDSISVNGTCLTAKAISPNSFIADVMVQTLRLTSLSDISIGDAVNLELALMSGSRMGGHIVQGHVDGVGEVIENSTGEKWNKLVIRIPQHLAKYVVNQGSIAIDGVSLTVGEIKGDLVTLWLIPETLAKTNLDSKLTGSKLNIEVDLLAKYVERLMKAGD